MKSNGKAYVLLVSPLILVVVLVSLVTIFWRSFLAGLERGLNELKFQLSDNYHAFVAIMKYNWNKKP